LKPEVDIVAELATEYANKQLDELETMEKAIAAARNIKKKAMEHNVPEDDVEVLRAACRLAEQRMRITVPITLVIQTSGCGGDPCSVYSSIVAPDWVSAWDCEVYDDSIWNWPDGTLEQIKANELALKAHLETANKIRHEFETKHDVEAYHFLDD